MNQLVTMPESGADFGPNIEGGGSSRRFRIYHQIGDGGTSKVFAAWDRNTGRFVALKVFNPQVPENPEELYTWGEATLGNETNRIVEVESPYTIALYEACLSETPPYLILEFATGGSLAKHGGTCRLDPRILAQWMGQVSNVLISMHESSPTRIHRDVNPSNILLSAASRQPRTLEDSATEEAAKEAPATLPEANPAPGITLVAKLADFGLAHYLPVKVGGTPGFQAPETWQNHYSEQSDVFSLGATMYAMLGENLGGLGPRSGEEKYQEPSEKDLRRLCKGDRNLASILQKALRSAPDARYSSVREFAEDLRKYERGERPEHARPYAWWEYPGRIAWVHRTLLGFFTTVCVAVVVAGYNFLDARYQTTLALSSQRAENSEAIKNSTSVLNEAMGPGRSLEPELSGIALGIALDALKGRDEVLEQALRTAHNVTQKSILPLEKILQVHGNIRGCAVTPDGKLLAVGTASKWVHFFRLPGGEKAGEGYPTGPVNTVDSVASVVCSPDGTLFAVATGGGKVHFLDVKTLRASARIKPIEHPGGVQSVAFSPDSSLVVVAGRSALATAGSPASNVGIPLAVYNIATGERIVEKDTGDDLYTAAFSSDGRWLAVGGGFPPAHGLTIWDLHNPNNPPSELPQMTRLVTLAFQPGKPNRLLTGDFDGRVVFWDLIPGKEGVSGRQIGRELKHPEAVRVLAFSESGRWLLVTGEDGTGRLFDAESRVPVGQKFQHVDQVRAGAVSEATNLAITTDFRGQIRLWSLSNLSQMWSLSLPGAVRNAVFDDSGQRILTGCNGSSLGLGRGTIWHWRENRTVNLPHEADVMALAFRPGRLGQAYTGANNGTSKMWHPDGSLAQELERTRLVYTAEFLDENRLVIGGLGKGFSVHHCEKQPDGRFSLQHKLQHPVSSFLWKIHRVNGGFVSTGGRFVKYWKSTPNGFAEQVLLELPEDPTKLVEVRLPAVDGQGRFVVSADLEGSVRLHDLSGPGMKNPVGVGDGKPHGGGQICADFSQVGNLLATGGLDGKVRLWDLNGNATRHPILSHARAVNVVRFSPCGEWLATGCQDGGVRLWFSKTGTWTGAAWFHTEAITCLQFSPDSNYVLSGSRDGIVRVLEVPTPTKGTVRDLLEGIEADAGISAPRATTGTAAAFSAAAPLTQEQLEQRLPARQRQRR